MRRMLSVCVFFCLTAVLLSGCAQTPKPSNTPLPVETLEPLATPTPTPKPIKNPEGGILSARFNPPPGYTRQAQAEGDFGAYLQALPLKSDGSPVLMFDGSENPSAPQAAVLDISKTSQQQGSRALVRLRAEYLFQTGQIDRITYHFRSGFVFSFVKWCEGWRVNVDGQNVEWVKKADPSGDHDALLSYMNTLFAYSNTLSLQAELQPAQDPRIGDIFINTQSGAVMIVDMAVSDDGTGRVFLLAQSPTPTQDIYILRNDADPALSPWYSASGLSTLTTPDGSFAWGDLRRFDEQITDNN